MKKLMINFRLLLLACLICSPFLTMAQFDFDDPDDVDDVGDTNVPFDDNVGILLFAGIAYGVKKEFDQKKKAKKLLRLEA